MAYHFAGQPVTVVAKVGKSRTTVRTMRGVEFTVDILDLELVADVAVIETVETNRTRH